MILAGTSSFLLVRDVVTAQRQERMRVRKQIGQEITEEALKRDAEQKQSKASN